MLCTFLLILAALSCCIFFGDGMKNLSAFEAFAEIVAIALGIIFFVMMFAAVGCDRVSSMVQIISEASEAEEIRENVVSVSKSYKIVVDSGASYVYRTDLDGYPRMVIIERVGVFSVESVDGEPFSAPIGRWF